MSNWPGASQWLPRHRQTPNEASPAAGQKLNIARRRRVTSGGSVIRNGHSFYGGGGGGGDSLSGAESVLGIDATTPAESIVVPRENPLFAVVPLVADHFTADLKFSTHLEPFERAQAANHATMAAFESEEWQFD